ncbi:MAG: hypothetical protein PHV16_03095 [Candidatus Nanoarchaeia archaeon]|nr:hypothetical protein [Candidatus Nanoarchaeia archaeon]
MALENLIFNIVVAFCFGATNALIIALASSKGTEAGYLNSLLGDVKKAIFLVSIIALGFAVYIKGITDLIPILILIILINTIIFGIYFGKKWKIPTNAQTLTMTISGIVSLLIWYVITVLTFI